MRMVTCGIFLMTMLGGQVAIRAGDGDDKAKLQGTWNAVAIVEKGRPEAAEKVRTLKLIITGDQYVYEFDGKDKKIVAAFKLDPTAKPKAIDVVFDEGPFKGKTMKSIYSLDGDD